MMLIQKSQHYESPDYQKEKQLSNSIDTILEKEEPQIRAEIEQEANLYIKSRKRQDRIFGVCIAGAGLIGIGALGYEIINNPQPNGKAGTYLGLLIFAEIGLCLAFKLGESYSQMKRMFKAKAYLRRESVESFSNIPYHKPELERMI